MNIDEYRALAFEWCEFAVNGGVGRMVDDPVYRWVTEKRDPGPGYSSCGDLAHWLMFRLGVRMFWVNRREHNGWHMGQNVSLLCPDPVFANPISRAPEPDEVFACGDIVVAWAKPKGTDAHVMVVSSHEPSRTPSELVTWDYGGGPMGVAAWSTSRKHIEAARRTRIVKASASGRWTFEGGKSIRSVLPLASVIEAAREADALVEPEYPTGEFLESRGLLVT